MLSEQVEHSRDEHKEDGSGTPPRVPIFAVRRLGSFSPAHLALGLSDSGRYAGWLIYRFGTVSTVQWW